MLPFRRLIRPALLTRGTPIYIPSHCTWLSNSTRNLSSQETRADRERVSKLLISIRDFLRQKTKGRDIEDFVHSQLRFHLSQRTTIPHVAFAKVISLLVEQRHLAEASSVYGRMIDEGYVPPPSIDAKMIAVALALAPDDLTETCTVLDGTFANPMYTEEDFLEFLQTCLDLGMSHTKLVSLITRFLNVQQEGFSPSRQIITKLVDAQARAGNFRQALEVLSVFSEEDVDILDPSRSSTADPFTAVMAAIDPKKPFSKYLVQRVLRVMEAQGIAPNSKVFDILIQRHTEMRSFGMAITLYRSLLEMSDNGKIHPTDTTFSLMFKLLARTYNQSVPKRDKEQIGNAAASLKPRGLYRTMISYAFSTIHPLSMNSSVLNDALYMFIASRDYPAAFLVIRAFDLFDLDVNIRTYRIVILHVWVRLREDFRRNASPSWVANLLGGASPPGAQSKEQLVSRILAWMGQKEFKLGHGPYDPKVTESHSASSGTQEGAPAYCIPSLPMLNREEPPLGVFLDTVPLARLLRRAILANIQTTSPAVEGPPGALVSKAISDAKSHLLPHRQEQGARPSV